MKNGRNQDRGQQDDNHDDGADMEVLNGSSGDGSGGSSGDGSGDG